tara:strand:- start:1905 stop:3026 length:1122 start_codon:yes stop_codon:yes gene_type:complete
MKNQTVTITDSRIYYTDRPSSIVMDEVSKSLMKTYSDVICQNGGNVLDIGFGLGYSANFMYENVGNYTCIEINPQIYQTALKWANGKPNVTIIFGNWFDIIPTLNQKFDGIFMDTFSDLNYYKFEDYAKLIANENCILSIYEYHLTRKLNELNTRFVSVDTSKYPKRIKNSKEICWTYYSYGEFRKEKLYDRVDSLLSKESCDKIISEYKDKLKVDDVSANIKGVSHTRKLEYTKVILTQNVIDELNLKVFKEFDNVPFDDLWVRLFKYNEGDLYDRHVETIKGLPFNNPNQFCKTIDITLNDSYEGGTTDIYNKWNASTHDEYTRLTPNIGEALIYKPYYHVSYNTPTSGERYQLIILVKNSDLKKKVVNLI